MSQRSNFFKSIAGDRFYSASDYSERFKAFLTSGVLVNNSLELGTELEVTTDETNLILDINLGKAVIEGYFYEIYSSAMTVTLDTADPTLPRIDRIILKLDTGDVARSIIVTKLTGTPAASPTAPLLTQAGNVFEISLAEVTVPAGATTIVSGNITDERAASKLLSGGLDYANINGDLSELFAASSLDVNNFINIRQASEPATPTNAGRPYVDTNGDFIYKDKYGLKSVIAPKQLALYRESEIGQNVADGDFFNFTAGVFQDNTNGKVVVSGSDSVILKAGYVYEILCEIEYKPVTDSVHYLTYRVYNLSDLTEEGTFGNVWYSTASFAGDNVSKAVVIPQVDTTIKIVKVAGDNVEDYGCNVKINVL